MEPINHLMPIPGALTALKQIELFRHSQSRVDRQVWARARVMELFLRVLVEGVKEILYVTMVPFAAVKLVLDRTRLDQLLPWSISFGEIADHLKRASRCATALALDFPAIFIDPSKAQTRLVNRKLLALDIQPEPTTFESLLKYVWTPEVITVAGVVITALVLRRLGLSSSGGTDTPPNPSPLVTPVPSGIGWLVPLAATTLVLSLLCGRSHYIKKLNQKRQHELSQSAELPNQFSADDLVKEDYKLGGLDEKPTRGKVESWKGKEYENWNSWMTAYQQTLQETEPLPDYITDKEARDDYLLPGCSITVKQARRDDMDQQKWIARTQRLKQYLDNVITKLPGQPEQVSQAYEKSTVRVTCRQFLSMTQDQLKQFLTSIPNQPTNETVPLPENPPDLKNLTPLPTHPPVVDDSSDSEPEPEPEAASDVNLKTNQLNSDSSSSSSSSSSLSSSRPPTPTTPHTHSSLDDFDSGSFTDSSSTSSTTSSAPSLSASSSSSSSSTLSSPSSSTSKPQLKIETNTPDDSDPKDNKERSNSQPSTPTQNSSISTMASTSTDPLDSVPRQLNNATKELQPEANSDSSPSPLSSSILTSGSSTLSSSASSSTPVPQQLSLPTSPIITILSGNNQLGDLDLGDNKDRASSRPSTPNRSNSPSFLSNAPNLANSQLGSAYLNIGMTPQQINKDDDNKYGFLDNARINVGKAGEQIKKVLNSTQPSPPPPRASSSSSSSSSTSSTLPPELNSSSTFVKRKKSKNKKLKKGKAQRKLVETPWKTMEKQLADKGVKNPGWKMRFLCQEVPYIKENCQQFTLNMWLKAMNMVANSGDHWVDEAKPDWVKDPQTYFALPQKSKHGAAPSTQDES